MLSILQLKSNLSIGKTRLLSTLQFSWVRKDKGWRVEVLELGVVGLLIGVEGEECGVNWNGLVATGG